MGNTLLDGRPSEEVAFESSEYEVAYGEEALSWASSTYVRIGALTVAALAVGAVLGIMATELTGNSTSAELATPPTTATSLVEQDPGLSESLTPAPANAELTPLVIGADEATNASSSTSIGTSTSEATGTTAPNSTAATTATSRSTTATSAPASNPASRAATTASRTATTASKSATTASRAATTASRAATTASTAAPSTNSSTRRTTTTTTAAESRSSNVSTASTTAGGNDQAPGNGNGTDEMPGNGGGDGTENGGDQTPDTGGGHTANPGSWVRASSENASYRDGPIATTHHIFDPYSSNAPGGWGASRIGFLVHCEPVMTKQIDPIVNPGQARSAHLHDFFGNPNVTPNSTTQSLANTPSSQIDCTDKNDKSGYWTPSAYQNGTRVPANAFKAYYKSLKPNTVPMPFGLRMVAGNAGATKNQDRSVGWWQSEESITTAGKSSMITKSSTGKVRLRINFPNCWDGVHLDSPDHKSHVAYARGGGCPGSHPVAIPQVVTFTDYLTNGGGSFTLASGDWFTFHQDFWNVWSPDQMEALHKRCNLAEMNCRARSSPDLVPRGQKAVSIRG